MGLIERKIENKHKNQLERASEIEKKKEKAEQRQGERRDNEKEINKKDRERWNFDGVRKLIETRKK